jgi:hypothetical protein
MRVNGFFVAVPQIARNLTAQTSQPLKPNRHWRDRLARALVNDWELNVMNVRQLRISRRSLTIGVALVGLVSLAIGAHAALNKRGPDAAKDSAKDFVKAAATEQSSEPAKKAARVALVIGNGHYPDAAEPLAQPINDARGLSAALRGNGFEVDVVEDATKDDMARAIGRMKSKITSDTVVMLFFGGYGVQVGRESYMIPVDAAIWKESDVRRDGVSIEQVLAAMNEQGAKAKLVVVDASRRNPYERRFRSFSHGLAPISAPENALILTSATPGKVADDSKGQYSVLVTELLHNLDAQTGAETAFNKTRVTISRASEGEQVPSVSSSLLEDIRIGG